MQLRPGKSRERLQKQSVYALCSFLPIPCFTSPPIFVSRLFDKLTNRQERVRPSLSTYRMATLVSLTISLLSKSFFECDLPSLTASYLVPPSASVFTFCGMPSIFPFASDLPSTCLPSCSGPLPCLVLSCSVSQACCARGSASFQSAF